MRFRGNQAGPRSGFIFLLILCAGSISALLPQELSVINFQNLTGFSIKKIFARETGTEDWGADLIGKAQFPHGATKTIFMHYTDIESSFDFTFVDDRGARYERLACKVRDGASNLFDISSKFKTKAGSGTSSYVLLYITNNTNRLVSYLFLSPKSWHDWGPEVLRQNQILSAGDTSLIEIPSELAAMDFELLAITKDHAIIQLPVVIKKGAGEAFLDLTNYDLH